MNPDKVCDEIRKALGNPDSGALASAMPIITKAVHDAMTEKPAKETRVVKAVETRSTNDDSEK